MIDHLVYSVPDLKNGIDRLEDLLGVRAAFGGKHLGLGTHNAIMQLGDSSYLELIAADPGQHVDKPKPFGVEPDMPPRLVGWAIRKNSIAERVVRSRAAGYDPGEAKWMERKTAYGRRLRWRLTPTSIESGMPFLIDWGGSEHPSCTAPRGVRLANFHIEHPDPVHLNSKLQAMEVDVRTELGLVPAFVAILDSPHGYVELR